MELFAFVFGIIAKEFFCLWFFFIFGLFFSRERFVRSVVSFLCGFALISLHESLYPALNFTVDHTSHHFLGKVLNFEQQKAELTKCLVEVLAINHEQKHFKIWLYYSDKKQHLLPGEVWTWQGRMKPFLDFANPGVDTVWYRPHFRHIETNVFVLGHLKRQQKLSTFDLLSRLRIKIYQRAYLYIHDSFARSLFLTLILGIGSELDSTSWEMFKSTGTVHLMVISGAHLSLVMGLCSKFIELIRYPFPRVLKKYPLKQISSLFSLMIGLVYAFVSGFGIPVQRAWFMTLMRWYYYLGRRRINSWQAFRWSLFIVLIIEPHAVWYPGAYLSYLAVAILIFCAKFKFKNIFHKEWITQFACLLGLGPLTLLWFGNLPVLGLLSNMLAIPLVSWVLLPLAFLIALMLLTHVFNPGVLLFDQFSEWFQWGLSHLAILNKININAHWAHPTIPWILLFSLYFGFVYPKRTLLLSLVLMNGLCLLPHPRVLKPGEFVVDVIDVGQGLAVSVKTKYHHLLFDTGGMLGKHSIAMQTIVPFFKYQWVNRVDKLVISHPDLDHGGGLEAIQTHFRIKQLLVDNPRLYQRAKSCHQTQNWCWDEICFHFVKYKVAHASKNNHSCVLKVFNQKFQVLLTGDIEKEAEYAILRQEKHQLRSTVLLIPHHGSQTSSSFWLLDMVKPKIALLSVAKVNAYHLPHPKILDRYRALHIPIISTATSGLVHLLFTRQKFHVLNWRQRQAMSYWLM